MTRKQSEERRQRIVELTRQGRSAAQIADELKINARTVVRVRVERGVAQSGPQRFTADELAQVEAMLDDGCSITEAARTIGRSPCRLWEIYRGRGWTAIEAAQYAALRFEMRRKRGIDI